MLELIGACVNLLMKEGSTRATMKEIRSLINVMVHINRCSVAGSCLVQPLLSVMMDRESTHLSLDVGDRLCMGLLTSLLHGLPLKLEIGPAVAPDCGAVSGGAMEGAQAAPCFGAARTGGLRAHDSKDRAHEAILVVEEFGGVGSLTEALKLLGICPMGIIFIESDEKLRRHFKLRHPNALTFAAIEKVTQQDVATWRKAYPLATMVLNGGGWPCQDQSRLNPMRLGAESTRGRLLEPMLQASICPGCLPWTVAEFYENVMFDDQDKKIVFGKIGFPPLHIKGEEFMYCRRPRQFWLRNLDIPLGTDLSIQPVMRGQPHEHFQAAQCDTQLLPLSAFLEQGAERVKPTFTRPVKKTSPPAMAAGVKTASEAAKKRWKGDSFRLQVYHYEEDWLLRDQGGIRRLKAIECGKM
eukprot:s1644_g15.t1